MSVNPLHLFAEDPYHPPGYAGYVPQKMYRHAGTYGRTTHNILKGWVHRTIQTAGRRTLGMFDGP